MKKFIIDKYALFFTALGQVTFVAMNVVFISKSMIIMMLLTGFMISWLWSKNVKRITIGNWVDRITYATGAMCGTGLGYWISHTLIKFI